MYPKHYDVVALGELLIDFTQNDRSPQGNPVFEANPGGAPCNVLAMLQKLGYQTAFIGKVGNDVFGLQLQSALEEVGISTKGLCFDNEVKTTLAIVHTAKDGERDFSFYRKPGADMRLKKEEVPAHLLESCRIFHFGSLSLTDESVREATKSAVASAKRAGALISFDPNLRKPLWNTLEEAKAQIAYGFSQCDILKISDDEITWFTGETNYQKAVEKLRQQYEISLICLSLGKEGSQAYYKEYTCFEEAMLQKQTIETTGAGDTFMGCVLHTVLEKGLEELKQEDLQMMLRFANAAASVVTTRKGALRVMPNKKEIKMLLCQ